MRAAWVAALLSSLAAAPLTARDIILTPPIDCDLGADCFIQQYVDHDPSSDASDFRCSSLSYDGHKGTDFALRTHEHMRRGVNVLPAAPGTVRATRDGMRDAIYTSDARADVENRECGNGVVIDHGDGWSTQYCHLKRGSVTVRKGDLVQQNSVLGQVGLSGRTAFPHVHLTVRKDGKVVDPFDPDGAITCGTPGTDTLWQSELPYRPGGVLSVGFADAVPRFDDIKAGTAAMAAMPVDAPALVVFGYAFGGQAGDSMQLRIDGPDGVIMNEPVTINKDQAQFFRAVGKKRRANWPRGTYLGTVTLIRGPQVINSVQGRVVID